MIRRSSLISTTFPSNSCKQLNQIVQCNYLNGSDNHSRFLKAAFRRKDSNCGLPDIETSDKKIVSFSNLTFLIKVNGKLRYQEWSFTSWPKTYQIRVEPKVPEIDFLRSVLVSGEVTLNAPEISELNVYTAVVKQLGIYTYAQDFFLS